MIKKENSFEECKKQLLVEYFSQVCQFSPSADKFNFWFLGLLGVTSSILFYQLEVLNRYFSLRSIGFIFLFLAISGLLGIVSAYFAYLAQACYVITEKMKSPRDENYEAATQFNEENRNKLFGEFMIEIQQRLFPKPLIRLSNIFLKIFKPDILKMVMYELPAKFVVLQLLCLSLQVISYIIAVLLLASYFISH